MDSKYVERLVAFLVQWRRENPRRNAPRPPPDIGELLVLQTFLRPLLRHVDQEESDSLKTATRGRAQRASTLAKRVERIWIRYGSDEAFFSLVDSVLRTTKPHPIS